MTQLPQQSIPPWVTEIDYTWLEGKYCNDRSRFATVDGNRVHYRDEGAGPVVVMVHGTASSLHTWDPWVELLKKRFRVVRMDLPGFGLTGPDCGDRYEVEEDVNFLHLFLQKLGIQSAHLVGNSLGGRIIWQYALKYPTHTQSLTLINALGYPQGKWPPPIKFGQTPLIDKVMEKFSPRFLFQLGLKDMYFDQSLVTPKLVDRYFELSRYPGNLTAFTKRVKANLDGHSHLIYNIKAPTLVLWGKEDKYFPVVNAHKFKNDIWGAKVQIFPNVGHLPMEEVPEKSVQCFLEFVG